MTIEQADAEFWSELSLYPLTDAEKDMLRALARSFYGQAVETEREQERQRVAGVLREAKDEELCIYCFEYLAQRLGLNLEREVK